jgi:hypothetical protein
MICRERAFDLEVGSSHLDALPQHDLVPVR